MATENKILKEVEKFNSIKKYINEQEGEEPAGDDMLSGDVGLDDEMGMDMESEPTPINVEDDPDVEVVGDEGGEVVDGGGGTEELEITDLVNTQNTILDKIGNLDQIFSKLDDLTAKLGEMDEIISKIDNLEAKVEKYKPKSPEQKLELRSLDSYPFNQKLTDFFDDKEIEFEKSGKSEYVLTSDDVENFSDGDIQSSFDAPFEDE
jgi:hypothetical protein